MVTIRWSIGHDYIVKQVNDPYISDAQYMLNNSDFNIHGPNACDKFLVFDELGSSRLSAAGP